MSFMLIREGVAVAKIIIIKPFLVCFELSFLYFCILLYQHDACKKLHRERKTVFIISVAWLDVVLEMNVIFLFSLLHSHSILNILYQYFEFLLWRQMLTIPWVICNSLTFPPSQFSRIKSNLQGPKKFSSNINSLEILRSDKWSRNRLHLVGHSTAHFSWYFIKIYRIIAKCIALMELLRIKLIPTIFISSIFDWQSCFFQTFHAFQ